MKNKKFINALIGLWLIVISSTLIIGFLLSKMDRLREFPVGDTYNFYYTLIIGLCVLIYTTTDIVIDTSFARLIATCIVLTILLAVLGGIVFSECGRCGFNFNIASITGLLGACITGIIAGTKLMS